MNKEKVKKLVKMFHEVSGEEFFAAIMINEKIDYLMELEDLIDKDFEYLSELYEKFIDSDCSGLINPELIDYIEEESEEE